MTIYHVYDYRFILYKALVLLTTHEDELFICIFINLSKKIAPLYI